MNSTLHQYPAALYSAVQESGYRTERYTGEALRSSWRAPKDAGHRSLLSRIRHAAGRDGSRHGRRPVVVYPMHEAR